MKLLIDDANIDNIKYLYEYFPVSGVTTNPSILFKNKKDPLETLVEIREFIGDDQLHIQVLSDNADDIVKEARLLKEKFGTNTFIKIPTNKEGLKAMRLLENEKIKITATAIYSPTQAFLASLAGAVYVAPYVNRIDNLGYDGVETTIKIQNILEKNQTDTKVLAASFKNTNQVLKLAEYGISIATCSYEVFGKFIEDNNVNKAVEDFVNDFKAIDKDRRTWTDYLG
ncbi:transaldolase family protein [Anaerococcus sp.]|uniref:transaldolase family protein n=1 Tax=Anaerococcus sp. TaxID=1872515 RepID=UPI00280B74ED|nr:transaldolase family protein [Anaerococcus sp.]MDU2598725.1 transaldolase family protein [Anaerococcus sp.]MDU3177116.1 transaldolase family protein [Anaerococcus sp.]